MLLSTFISMGASAQTVTRPGGGGELDWRGPTKQNLFTDFRRVFEERIQKCDPKAKHLQSFPEIYNYLYIKHVDHLMSDHKDFLDQKMPKCRGHEGEVLHCLLTKKVKEEMLQLSANPEFKKYLRKEMKLSKEEAEARIIFFHHLSETPKE